jgi:hypothetical protein
MLEEVFLEKRPDTIALTTVLRRSDHDGVGLLWPSRVGSAKFAGAGRKHAVKLRRPPFIGF